MGMHMIRMLLLAFYGPLSYFVDSNTDAHAHLIFSLMTCDSRSVLCPISLFISLPRITCFIKNGPCHSSHLVLLQSLYHYSS